MSTWTNNELKKVGDAEELQIAGRKADGSMRKRVTIWVVRVGDGLYVRSYQGNRGAWYRGALARHEGRIWAGGVEKDVSFVEVSDPGVNDQIDEAYQSKYGRYSQFVSPMLTDEVRATTLKLVPQSNA